MMDLDEAIQHCKEQVQEQAKKGCYSCAEEHQQLAEWLKELKACREERRMKLLIDIPEHIYEHAKEMTEDSRDEGEAMRAIANGTQQESRSEIPNTCGDAISRKHLLEEIAMLKKSPWFNENTYGSKVIRKEAVEIVEDVCIKREPSVTPQPRTGWWIDQQDNGRKVMAFWERYECSECGCHHNNDAKFCPNCGSRMMEVEDAD